jgi:hypothetical protein
MRLVHFKLTIADNLKSILKLYLVKTSLGGWGVEGGGLLFVLLLVIVGFEYLKIKISKNCSGLVLLFLGNLKNCLGLGHRNLKTGSYEVGVGVRVCD